eukprot:NODE_646_length_5582_cov_0.573044.p5 type:complete len:123 gc:universal NODE_646_length_5582_cov_0.573044:453-85(-)
MSAELLTHFLWVGKQPNLMKNREYYLKRQQKTGVIIKVLVFHLEFSKNHQNSDSGYEVSNWSIEQIQFYNKMINTVNEKESGINIFGDLLGSQKLVEDAEFENLNNSARTSFIMGHKIQKLD